MGSSQHKDPNIEMFVQCNKPYYVAGEYIEGCVHLNAKINSNYSNVTIYLEGQEYVCWTERRKRGKNHITVVYRNRYDSYKGFFMMKDFKGNLPQGQYTLPFAFLLPAMMCGSFYHSDRNFIKYFIKS